MLFLKKYFAQNAMKQKIAKQSLKDGSQREIFGEWERKEESKH